MIRVPPPSMGVEEVNLPSQEDTFPQNGRGRRRCFHGPHHRLGIFRVGQSFIYGRFNAGEGREGISQLLNCHSAAARSSPDTVLREVAEHLRNNGEQEAETGLVSLRRR